MTHPNLSNDAKLLKNKTKDGESEKLNYGSEKHDHGDILRVLFLIMIIIKMSIKV